MKWRRAQEPEPSDARLPSWTADVPHRDLTAEETPAPLSARIAQAEPEDVETLVARVLGEVDQVPVNDPGTLLGGRPGDPDVPEPASSTDDEPEQSGAADEVSHVERLLEALEDDEVVSTGDVATAGATTGGGSDVPTDEALASATSDVADRAEPFHVERAREAVAEALLALQAEDRADVARPPKDIAVDGPAAIAVEGAHAPRDPLPPDAGQASDPPAGTDEPDDLDGAVVRGWRRLRARLTRPEPRVAAPEPTPQAVTVRRVEPPRPTGVPDEPREPVEERPAVSAPRAEPVSTPVAPTARQAAPAPPPRRERAVRVESAPREALEDARRRATGAWQRPPPDGGAWGRVAERLDR